MLVIFNKFLCKGVISKVSIDVLPFVIVPVLITIAAISLQWAIGVFLFTIVARYFLRKRLLQARPRSTFFFVWTISSVIWIILVFNTLVTAFKEIYPEENFILVVMTVISLGCLYNAKMKAQKTLLPFKSSYINGDLDEKEMSENLVNLQNIDQPYFCYYCQANVPSKNHCVWLDCCVGIENVTLFFCGNLFGMIALVYGANLTLTTICHPFIFYYPYVKFLLPDDCRDAYYSTSYSIPFVCALYCILIAMEILWYLVKTILKKLGFRVDKIFPQRK